MTVDTSKLAAFNGEQQPPPDAPEPPRVPWLNEDGTPKYGLKEDGTPRKSKPGPGRPPKDAADKPRTTDTPPADPAPPGPAAAARDYTADLQSAGTAVWVGLSSMPWTKAHARLWASQIGGLAAGLNEGAQHNAKCRAWVEKIAGEGSVLWVLPLATSVASLAAGSWQLLQDKQLRAQLAADNDVAFQTFVAQQARAMGLDPDPEQTPDSGQPSDGICQNTSHDRYGQADCQECLAATSPAPSGMDWPSA